VFRVPQEQVPVPGCTRLQEKAGKQGQAPTAAQPEPVPRTTPPGSLGRNSWPGWGRSFRWSARGAAATSGSSRYTQAGVDPEGPHASGRTARASASLSRPWPAHRLGRARPGPRRPGDFSGVTRRAARDRHPQPLTAAGRRVTTKPRGGRTRRDSAPPREKRRFRGERGRSGEPLSGPGLPRNAGVARSRAAHASGDACGSAIDRTILRCRGSSPYPPPNLERKDGGHSLIAGGAVARRHDLADRGT
jgi:hypothetical protein